VYEADKQDLGGQVNYWQSQINQAQDLLNSPYEADHPLDTQQVQKDIANYKAKIALIQQHIDYGVAPSREVQIIVSPEMQPFVTLDKDTYAVDVQGSLASGISPDRLAKIGVDRDYIDKLQALHELVGYKTASGGYYIEDIIKDGKVEILRKAGFDPQVILDAQIAVARTPKEIFDDLKQSGDIPKDATFIGADKDGRIRYSTQEQPAQTKDNLPVEPIKSYTMPRGGHEVTEDLQIVNSNKQDAYDAIGNEFKKLDHDTQQFMIAETFYNMPNTAKKSFDRLTETQKQQVIKYYLGGLLARTVPEKGDIKKAALVGVMPATGPVGWILIGGFLVTSAAAIYIGHNKALTKAVNDYIDNFGHAPPADKVSVTTSTGQTIPLTEYTEQVRLDTKLPPITGIKINTREALVPPRMTTTLPTFTPPTITTKLPTLTPPAVNTKTPTLVPPKIDIPTMIVTETAVLDTPAVGKVLTHGELDRLWNATGGGSSYPGSSYLTGENINDLDQKVFNAYSHGALSRAEYNDYIYARDRYLQVKTGVETSTNTLIQGSPGIQKTTLPKEVVTAAIIAGLMVIKKSKKREEGGGGAVMPQVHQAIQAKIEDMTNTKLSVKNQTLVDNLTKTTFEISTKTLERTGTKTDTQTITKEGTKTVEQTVPKTKTATQTATQTATRTATAEATTTAEVTAEAEREAELTAENELTQELPIIPPPPDGGPAKKKLKRLPLGTVMRKQGFGYWINEPGRKSYFTKEKPKEFQDANSNSPYDTIQVVGGKSPERLPKQDMGIMDVFVASPPNVPIRRNRESIGFLRDPQFRTQKRKMPKSRQRDLGMGIVESRTKNGRKRHLRLT
jgi:hypothetical protein